MKKVIRINLETGMFIEDVIFQNSDAVPIDCIETNCEGGFYHPKWNGTEWVEGLIEDEISTLLLNQQAIKHPLTTDQVIDVLSWCGVWPL